VFGFATGVVKKVNPMDDDAALLRRYADEGSEPAFTELVRRHVDLVYGAALRRTGGDAHRAGDVAQQVFTALARHARKLSRHAVLGAWLHTATRNAALNLMISEQRRRAREFAALDSARTAGETGAEWDRLRPVLDAAIDELPEPDRAAVVLRFLERRAFADIGTALHVSEDAARKRTDRALDKLRTALARRGITSTAAALGVIVAGQPMVSAPAGLATSLAASSVVAAGISAGFFSTLSTIMNLKIVTAAALSALVAFLVGNHVGSVRSPATPAPSPAEMSRQAQAMASLRRDNERLRGEVVGLNADVAKLTEAAAAFAAQRAAPPPAPAIAPRGPTIGLARWEVQQAALNNLRQIDAARKQHLIEKGQPAGSITELVGRARYIKTVRTVDGEDYSKLSMNPDEPLTVTTPDGIAVTFDPTGANTTRPEFPPEVVRAQELGAKIQPAINQALSAFRAANNGKNPPNEQALVPFFGTAQEGADFVEFVEARKAAGL